jgi:hypothetical protein
LCGSRRLIKQRSKFKEAESRKLKRRIHIRRRKTGNDAFKNGVVTFSVYKTAHGGIGRKSAMESLKQAGIPCRNAYSPYLAQEGIEVPKEFEEEAEKILYPKTSV